MQNIIEDKRPAGWRGWIVAVPPHLRLRVRPRSKSVDFHYGENRQRPCRMVIRHVSIVRRLPPGKKLGVKITCGDWYPPLGRHTKKKCHIQEDALGSLFSLSCFTFRLTLLTQKSLSIPAQRFENRTRQIPILYFVMLIHRRSYRRIRDTEPPSYKGPNMCNYSPTNRVSYLKLGPEGIVKQGPFRFGYASLLIILLIA
ncbi:hypothetical protein TNCV_2344901 [Trichonephila clavipes]|nr:hypothetical protein TNCV_2344901 [Trichonephila clavipes]